MCWRNNEDYSFEDLRKHKWVDDVYNDCTFDGSLLFKVDFSRKQFINCSFQSTRLDGADLRCAYFKGCNFNHAYMDNVDFSYASFICCDMDMAVVSNATWKDNTMQGISPAIGLHVVNDTVYDSKGDYVISKLWQGKGLDNFKAFIQRTYKADGNFYRYYMGMINFFEGACVFDRP